MSIQTEALCSSCRVNTAYMQVFGRAFCNTCLETLGEGARASATPIAVEIRENYPMLRQEPNQSATRIFELKSATQFKRK